MPLAGAQAEVLSLAVDAPGSTFNSIGTGVAKVINDAGEMNVIARSYGGPAAWMPLLNSGEVQLGAVSANSAWQAFNGTDNVKEALKDFRVLRSGAGSLMLGMVVAAASGLTQLADTRARKTVGEGKSG